MRQVKMDIAPKGTRETVITPEGTIEILIKALVMISLLCIREDSKRLYQKNILDMIFDIAEAYNISAVEVLDLMKEVAEEFLKE